MTPSDSGLTHDTDGKTRCWWHGGDTDYIAYHDNEWGHPVDDDRRLFEKICLEGFQAGLSWITILRKRNNFRAAFDNFEWEKIACYTDHDIQRLLGNAGIIRHRGKIEATINNANRAIDMVDEFGSLAAYFWQFEPKNRPAIIDHPTLTANPTCFESIALSKDLKKRGWKFVGPTTIYAFMQAMGMVNDHLEGCYCRPIIQDKRKTFQRPSPSVNL